MLLMVQSGSTSVQPTDYSGEVEGEELDLTKLTVASGQTLVFKN